MRSQATQLKNKNAHKRQSEAKRGPKEMHYSLAKIYLWMVNLIDLSEVYLEHRSLETLYALVEKSLQEDRFALYCYSNQTMHIRPLWLDSIFRLTKKMINDVERCVSVRQAIAANPQALEKINMANESEFLDFSTKIASCYLYELFVLMSKLTRVYKFSFNQDICSTIEKLSEPVLSLAASSEELEELCNFTQEACANDDTMYYSVKLVTQLMPLMVRYNIAHAKHDATDSCSEDDCLHE